MVSYSDSEIPQLLGFIAEELSKSAPCDWTSFIVEVEVFYEASNKAISTVNFYTTMSNQAPQRFVPNNVIGTMNAFLKIHALMSDSGGVWRKATFSFDNKGSVDINADA